MTCHAPRSSPAARTRTSTCSSPTSGTSTSLRRRMSAEPYRSRMIAFIGRERYVAAGSLVVQRVQDVEPGGAAGRHDRRREAGEDGDDRKGGQLRDRDRERDVVLRERLGHEPGEEDAEREPECRADQRGDDALVADHPAR